MPASTEKLREYKRNWARKHSEEKQKYLKKWREKNPEKTKESSKKSREKNREKMLERTREWRKKNPNKIEEYSKKYRKIHREERKEDCRKYHQNHKDLEINQRRLREYGITEDEFKYLLKKQDGRCAICKNNLISKICIDHNHVTGEVRGLLCNPCNMALGLLKDDIIVLTNALKYLEGKGEIICVQPQ
jgi:membrane-associated HD superfamily phosphohydrolase